MLVVDEYNKRYNKSMDRYHAFLLKTLLSMVVHAFDLSTQESEAGGL